MSAPIGLLPAAGRGLRFGGSGYDKELFPLLFTDGDQISARPICDLSLRAIAACGAERCLVIVSPEKAELIRVLAGVERPHLSFIVQTEPRGLPDVVACAAPWLDDRNVLLALPDTIVLPHDALHRVHCRLVERGADLVLGAFPVDEPERLGPIEFDADGRVQRVLDKPGNRAIMNSWAIAAWSPRFTRFCVEWEQKRRAQSAGERALGHVFQDAVAAGLDVQALYLMDGLFLDIGTPTGLRAALTALAERQLLDPAQAHLLHRPR